MTAPDTNVLLAIDAGTTLIKAALYTREGECLGVGQTAQPTHSPSPGYAEQDPLTWWQGVRRAVRRAIQDAIVSGEAVAAIGLSTQGGSLAVFDAQGRPKGRALVWNDLRQRAPSGAPFDEEHFTATGLSHLSMSPTSLTWLRQQHPEWFTEGYRVGYVPDYLTYRLTGRWITDPTNLGISNLCELATGDIAPHILARVELARAAFAETRRGGEIAGQLTPRAAKALGVTAGIPVATPAHDQYAGALGANCTEPGDIVLSGGTAWVLLFITDHPVIDRASSFWPAQHIVPGRWGVLGSIASGGSTLNQLLQLTRGGREWERINQAAAEIAPGSDGLLVLPHLAGRSVPTGDPEACGAILGWTFGHTRAHLWRAAMEGLACNVRAACDYLAGYGAAITSLRLVGGAARSPLIPAILASLLDVPVITNAEAEIAVRGAACLAARALGWPDLLPASGWKHDTPAPAWRKVYEDLYARYQRAVRALEA